MEYGAETPELVACKSAWMGELPLCGALRLCMGNRCEYPWDVPGSQLIHPHDVRPQGLPASSGAFGLYSTVQDKHVQSNPDLMWAADLPSWVRTVSPLHLAQHSAPEAEQLLAGVCPLWLLAVSLTSSPYPQTKDAQTPHLLSQQAENEETMCDYECCR